MALHLTLKSGQSFEIKHGVDTLKVSVKRKNSCIAVQLEGPREFEISRVIKSESVSLSAKVRKKIHEPG